MSVSSNKEGNSKIRKIYIARLVGRCVVLVLSLLVWLFERKEFDVLDGMNFFKDFSIFHILWGIWLIDMILQVVPAKNHIALGSQKLFRFRFRPIKGRINKEALKEHAINTTRAAYKVLILWCTLIAVIGALYFKGIISKEILLLISIAFYVCDLICVLVWCPFRLMMRNKCCTTCRIFNWDHLMMFSPLIFVVGFYSWSLVLMSLVVWIVWEACIFFYPERFFEQTNMALRCSECTDKLCTQYCQKLRK